MKHLLPLLLLLLGLPLAGRAQPQPQYADSLSRQLTRLFAPLDKSQVPTGRLYEAGVRFLDPTRWDGTLGDSNQTSMGVLRYLLAQFASSRVAGSDTLPHLPELNT